MKLLPSETLLIGKWVVEGREVVADDICQRIDNLIGHHLLKRGCDTSGWNTLYCDPADNRIWELSYPQSNLQGGGPPQLRCVTKQEIS